MPATRETYTDLIGKTMKSVTADKDTMTFESEDGEHYQFYHKQDCCESVLIDDICGDLNDLVGSAIVVAEEVSSDDAPPPEQPSNSSYTWTFYRFATRNGFVTVKWLGESNGYYSESVDFKKL